MKNLKKRLLVLTLDSQAAIDNLEALLAPELQVDAVLIGPHDLSCNLGMACVILPAFPTYSRYSRAVRPSQV